MARQQHRLKPLFTREPRDNIDFTGTTEQTKTRGSHEVESRPLRPGLLSLLVLALTHTLMLGLIGSWSYQGDTIGKMFAEARAFSGIYALLSLDRRFHNHAPYTVRASTTMSLSCLTTLDSLFPICQQRSCHSKQHLPRIRAARKLKTEGNAVICASRLDPVGSALLVFWAIRALSASTERGGREGLYRRPATLNGQSFPPSDLFAPS